jgi:hypothetical protein
LLVSDVLYNFKFFFHFIIIFTIGNRKMWRGASGENGSYEDGSSRTLESTYTLWAGVYGHDGSTMFLRSKFLYIY